VQVRPRDLAQLPVLAVIVLSRARGLDDAAITSRALRPTPMVLCMAIGHRFAAETEMPLSALDGERLLVPSPPGTPYTDLLIERLADAGASVSPVEAHVTGGAAILGELATTDAVARMPRGTPVPPGVTSVAITGEMTLPLFVLWATGRPTPAARHLIQQLGVSES
jgi:hypothetical protein